MREYKEIKAKVENLYHAGYECRMKTGYDTMYAPIRCMLETIIGEQSGEAPKEKRVQFSEEELRKMLVQTGGNTTDAKMSAAAIEWVLEERATEDLCDPSLFTHQI